MSKDVLQLQRLLSVIAGGFLGTIARYLLSLTIQGMLGKSWPFDILFINITGAFLIALLTTFAEAALFIGPKRRLFFNVGFLGAYTTFSSLALGSVNLLAGQQLWLALLYIVCSLLGGILAVLLGQYCSIVVIARIQQSRATTASPSLTVPEERELMLNPEVSTTSLHEEERQF